jgi:cobalt-zinc-cadmium efflux system membrane fusion protein
MSLRHFSAWCALAAISLTFAACSNSADKADSSTAASHSEASGHSHDGWWCNEHGVPEEVCALCDSSLVADFKAKGDWCEKHNRPDSQCFICHPEYQAKFAELYEAKYGTQPPKAGEGDEHDHDHAAEAEKS